MPGHLDLDNHFGSDACDDRVSFLTPEAYSRGLLQRTTPAPLNLCFFSTPPFGF